MIKLISGKKGSGKTKILIEAINSAESITKGNIVAIQIGSSLNINVSHRVRLINIEETDVSGYDEFYGFIAGILASDYDCTDIFVDGLLRICGRDYEKIGQLFDRIDKIAGETVVTLTISADKSELPEIIQKYL